MERTRAETVTAEHGPAAPRNAWKCRDEMPLDASTLHDLYWNFIPAIRIADFALPEECSAFVQAAEEEGFDYYEGVLPRIGRIGVTQFESSGKEKHTYFDHVADAAAKRERIVARAFDPVARIASILARTTGSDVRVAEEPGFGPYFAGLIRRIRLTLVHMDFAGLDAPGWSIGDTQAQISWNLFLQLPDRGGSCTVYNRPWIPPDEQLKMPGSYGYNRSLVWGVESFTISPRLGDVVLFNSRNYHEVHEASGDRLTTSSFVGLKPSGTLVLWS